MAGANTDLLSKVYKRWVGQIGSGGVADGTTTTIPLASSTNLPTDTAVIVVIDRVDSNGTATASLEETVIGVVSGNSLVTSTRGIEGTAQAHNAGAVVELLFTQSHWNKMISALLTQHNQLGGHTNITASNITASATVSASHLTASDIALRVLLDVNANELLKFTALASAVNELTITNAITASNPTACMTGGDTDVGLDLKMKGAGRFRKPTVVGIAAVAPASDTSTGDGKAGFRIPAELSGMNLTGVAAMVTTAGTTNTTDAQIRRVRAGAAADMLSTKITIDSTEVDTSTAAAAAVINASNDDVVTGDQIYVDIDAVSTTAAKGLYVELRFELP